MVKVLVFIAVMVLLSAFVTSSVIIGSNNDGEGVIIGLIDATTGFFSNLFVGSTTETIDPSSFVMDGNDVFIEDKLGVEGNIYTDSMIIGVNNQSVNFLSNGDVEFKLT